MVAFSDLGDSDMVENSYETKGQDCLFPNSMKGVFAGSNLCSSQELSRMQLVGAPHRMPWKGTTAVSQGFLIDRAENYRTGQGDWEWARLSGKTRDNSSFSCPAERFSPEWRVKSR